MVIEIIVKWCSNEWMQDDLIEVEMQEAVRFLYFLWLLSSSYSLSFSVGIITTEFIAVVNLIPGSEMNNWSQQELQVNVNHYWIVVQELCNRIRLNS